MSELFLLAVPLIILVMVALLAFTGCGLDVVGLAGEVKANYQDAPRAEPSLVGYWRLGETSGTVASDVKGAHPGEYEGGVTLGVPGLISGDPNTAVFFDGTSGDVTVPPSAAGPAAALNPSKFSVEA
ncbi:MAG: hypothetical protein ACJ76S_10225, partial [Solirubrobacteraceae bacterium]